MRVLLFRAWDKEKKKWLWPYPELFSIIGEVTVFDMLKPHSIQDYNNIVITQYIGQEDKNNIKICDGDIIKDGKTISIVEFYGTGYKAKQIDIKNRLIPGKKSGAEVKECEIIGNIFES